MSLITPIPNGPFYSNPSNYINSPLGFLVLGSGLAVDPTGTLLSASALGGTVTQVTAGIGLLGGTITVTGTIDLAAATITTLGGIKVGANLTVAADGTLSALPPGTGTISSITVGSGLTGGGIGPAVSINLAAASNVQVGGVSIVTGGGITVAGGAISLTPSTTTQRGGVLLASSAEVIAGADATKAITPATLQTKVSSTTVRGLVQLSDSVAANDSTKAATQTAAKTAYDAAIVAQGVANAALPMAGGTMTGIIAFAAGQTFPGVALPKATTTSLGVVQVGAGITVNASGVISTTNNGTVTAIIPGPGLGAPATGNPITTAGTIRLLPPTTDGLQLGGVKQGANILIGVDGTISASGLLMMNNPFSFNGYIWPIPSTAPGLPCPGAIGQVLTVADNVTGQLAWTSPTGTLSSVIAGAGIDIVSTATTATVSLATVPSITPGNIGGTALIPTLAVNAQGQITSMGLANPFVPFQIPSIVAPFILTLDFAGNNTNWEWTTNGNTTIQNPLNAVSGQTGSLLITQDPLSPYTITWGNSWKFASFTPFTGAGVAEVTLLKFTVVAPNYIVIDTVVTNIG